MQFGRYLAYSLLATLAGLPVGAFAGSLIFGLYGQLESGDAQALWPSLGAALGFSVPAVLFGLVPALLWGAPAYAALAMQGRATWLGAVAIGVAPGAVTLAVANEWGTVLIMFGAPVAIATHLFARNRVRALHGSGPNHSSKRTREKPRAA